ncbi:MAG: DUF4412 domain-containing protein [Opitutaceae bacterium]
MKKFLTSLLAGALLFPAALSAANFEGKITTKMTMAGSKDPIPMTQSVKDGFARTDMAMGKGATTSMIMDQAKQQIVILLPDQKMYMVQPMPKPDEAANGKAEDFTFEKTSETEKILGYNCTKYLVKNKDGSSEIWATEQLGTYLGLGAAGGGGAMGNARGKSAASYAWEKALIGKNFFPLRTVVFGKDGKESVRMEAVSVEKQSLPASLFVPPADYQKFEMPAMGDMMKGMMKGMTPGNR